MTILSYSPEALALVDSSLAATAGGISLQASVAVAGINISAPDVAADDVAINFSGLGFFDNLLNGVASAGFSSPSSSTASNSELFNAGNSSSLIDGLKSLDDLSAGEFFVIYKDRDNNEQQFGFTLLPAIETAARQSGASVPELKPGLLYSTSMKVKNFSIPGASPAFQMLGIEQSIFQLVGSFIGNEGSSSGNKSTASLYSIPSKDSLNAHASAMNFNYDVVQLGKPVTIVIRSFTSKQDKEINIKIKCLIQSIRYFFTRADRTYYAIDSVVLDYARPSYNLATPTNGSLPTSGATTLGAGVGASIGSGTNLPSLNSTTNSVPTSPTTPTISTSEENVVLPPRPSIPPPPPTTSQSNSDQKEETPSTPPSPTTPVDAEQPSPGGVIPVSAIPPIDLESS